LPQPNLNFGQRQPQVEYQVASESASVLSRTISSLTTQMFNTAQSFADEAGQSFVADNPVTKTELDGMVNGNVESFKRKFSINAFGAAVNKWKSHEVASHFELESIKDSNETIVKIETGKNPDGTTYNVDFKKIAEDWKKKTDGYSSALSSFSPDAAFKFRATAAVHGNKLFQIAAKAESERNFLQNQIKIEQEISQYPNTVRTTIETYKGADPAQLQDLLMKDRQRMVDSAMLKGGIPAQKLALQKSAEIEVDVMKAMFQNHIFANQGDSQIGDQTIFNKRIREKTLPPGLQNIWNIMTPQQQKAVRDGVEQEFTSLTKLKADQKVLADKDLDIAVAVALDTVYDKFSSPERRTEAMVFLRSTSLTNPDKVSPKFYAIDLPKSLAEKVDDDPGGKADMIENFRNNRYATVRDALDDAIGLGVTPATATTLAKEYLPKDATEKSRLQSLADIEQDLRTKAISKGNITELKRRLGLAGLTTADMPPDFIRLLNEELPVIDQKDDDKRYGELADLIERGEIPTVSALYQAKVAPGKGYITSESYRRLGDQLNRRNERLQADGRTVGERISDQSNSQSKTTKAEIAANARQDADDTYLSLLDEYNKTGSFTDYQGKKQNRPPTKLGDAGAIVEARFQEDKKRRNIDAQEKNIATNYGSNSPYLSADQKKLNPAFASIKPTFLNDKDMTADPTYIKSIIRELKRLGMETNNKEETTFTTTAGQQIGQNLINDQRSLEQARRKLRGR
jgi:hypothetical protein